MRGLRQRIDILIASLAVGVGGLLLLETDQPGLLSYWGLMPPQTVISAEASAGLGQVIREKGQLRLRGSQSSVWRDFDHKQSLVREGDAVYTSSDSEAILRIGDDRSSARVGPESLVVVKRPLNPQSKGTDSSIVLEVKKGRVTLQILPSSGAPGAASAPVKLPTLEVAGKSYTFEAIPEQAVSEGLGKPAEIELQVSDADSQAGSKVEIKSASVPIEVKVKPVEAPQERVQKNEETPKVAESVIRVDVGQAHVETVKKEKKEAAVDPVLSSLERSFVVVKAPEPMPLVIPPAEISPSRQLAAIESIAPSLPEIKQESRKTIELPEDASRMSQFRMGFSFELLFSQRVLRDSSTQGEATIYSPVSPGASFFGELPLSDRWSLYPEMRVSLAKLQQPAGQTQFSSDIAILGDLLAGIGTSQRRAWSWYFSAGVARRLSLSAQSDQMVQVGAVTMPMLQAQGKVSIAQSWSLGSRTRAVMPMTSTAEKASSSLGYEQEFLVHYYPKTPNRRQSFWGVALEVGRYPIPSAEVNNLDFSVHWGLQ